MNKQENGGEVTALILRSLLLQVAIQRIISAEERIPLVVAIKPDDTDSIYVDYGFR
jgi:hypothetical protein